MAYQPVQATLLTSEWASLTQFMLLPPRYADQPVPDWCWKQVFQDMNALRLQMDCKWVVQPNEIWRQLCLDKDLEVMFSAFVRPRVMRRAGHTRDMGTSSSLDSTTPDGCQTDLGFWS